MTRRQACILALALPAAACGDGKRDRRRRLRELLEQQRRQTSDRGVQLRLAVALRSVGSAAETAGMQLRKAFA